LREALLDLAAEEGLLPAGNAGPFAPEVDPVGAPEDVLGGTARRKEKSCSDISILALREARLLYLWVYG
jgi:hypothetical protein